MEDATHIVLNITKFLELVTVQLNKALRLILATKLHDPTALRPYPTFVKDGFAVITTYGPVDYPVILEQRAGNDASGFTVYSLKLDFLWSSFQFRMSQ